jgi:hypothetical protein
MIARQIFRSATLDIIKYIRLKYDYTYIKYVIRYDGIIRIKFQEANQQLYSECK